MNAPRISTRHVVSTSGPAPLAPLLPSLRPFCPPIPPWTPIAPWPRVPKPDNPNPPIPQEAPHPAFPPPSHSLPAGGDVDGDEGSVGDAAARKHHTVGRLGQRVGQRGGGGGVRHGGEAHGGGAHGGGGLQVAGGTDRERERVCVCVCMCMRERAHMERVHAAYVLATLTSGKVLYSESSVFVSTRICEGGLGFVHKPRDNGGAADFHQRLSHLGARGSVTCEGLDDGVEHSDGRGGGGRDDHRQNGLSRADLQPSKRDGDREAMQ